MIEYFLAWWGLGLFMGLVFGRMLSNRNEIDAISNKVDKVHPRIVSKPGLMATMAGWFDNDGNLHSWIDENPEGRQGLNYQKLSIYKMLDGDVLFTSIPYLATMISDCGHWFGIMEPGEYYFVFSRYDGEEFIVTRKVG